MKQKMLWAGAFLTYLLSLSVLPLQAQYFRKNKSHKGVNIALHITNQGKTPPSTYFSLGLLGNYDCLDGVSFNILSNTARFHVTGIQVAGFANITGLNASGIQVAGLANITGLDSRGFIVGGLVNVSGKSMKGISVSALSNLAGKDGKGIALGGLMNIYGGEAAGIHLATLGNIAKQGQTGLMLGGLMNVSGDTLRGVQLTSLLNVAGANDGVQVAALGNIAVANRGLQVAFSNYTAANKGLQLGIANVAGFGCRGLQLGLVNICADSLAHQIGCVNISPLTHVQLRISSGNLNKANVAVRFKNKYTYTELGLGAWYFDLDHDLSASGFYRAGVYFPLLSRLELSADAGYYHIETFDNKHKGYPARAYALQPRINLEVRISRKFGLFASGGYSWMRPYGGKRLLDRKGTFEAGIVLF